MNIRTLRRKNPTCEFGPRVSINDSVIIGENTVIKNDVEIWKNTTLGKNCIIREQTDIQDYVSIGDYVHIDENCILHQGVSIESQCIIGDSSRIGKITSIVKYTNIPPHSYIPSGMNNVRNVHTISGANTWGITGFDHDDGNDHIVIGCMNYGIGLPYSAARKKVLKKYPPTHSYLSLLLTIKKLLKEGRS